jgi:diguanylate cyclase (GGDEF)-like protein
MTNALARLDTSAVADVPEGEATSCREAAPRILIVDDIADNRAVLARRFVRRGFDVHEADGGAQALGMIDAQTFDLVLLDVMMPGIGGLDVLRTVRRTRSPLELPVIMVTAKVGAEDVVGALQLQANDYVTKPVNFDIALLRVNAQIDRKRAGERLRLANDALRRGNDDLERRVEERTRSLVKMNETLRVEIEQRERSESHSRFLAFHDALTGLPNRRQFRDDLVNAIATSGRDGLAPLAVLFVDLDGFKDVNDALGHSFGDLLLGEVATDFSDALGPTDRIARLGGDEFAILRVASFDAADTLALAGKLVEIACRRRSINQHDVTVGASVGVVFGSGPDDDPEALLKAADLAMYKAKFEGRGTFRVFDPAMDAQAQSRRMLETDLRNAQQLGQLEVFYQPQVSLVPHRLTGFEALLRWRHPDRGMVSPDEFIPLAEEIGLIVPIGNWVLREACREAAGWPGDLSVAVNVSPLQFIRGDLVNAVVQALAHSGLPPQRLELEITESVLMSKTEDNVSVLGQLRELGCRIAMDDFGTGYSSLSYLRMFPFDKIKIDRSFISDMIRDANCGAIVKAILAMSKSFGIKTIAEGVETDEQLSYLAGEGCAEVQGYYFGKPMNIHDALALMHSFPKAS